MRLKTLILLFVLQGVFFCLSAQETDVKISDSLTVMEGKEYLIHTVRAKQTLFSIAKAYTVMLSRIVFDNPGVLDGLQLGQNIRILKAAMGETARKVPAPSILKVDGDHVLYKVPPRQTLYSISKEYNTTVGAIRNANPELLDGLKVGMTIRIPVPRLLADNDTGAVKMIGLPDMTPHPNTDTLDFTSNKGHRMMHIAVMLPFYLHENDTIYPVNPMDETVRIFDRSEIALQFYEGLLLAADSLARSGYRISLDVMDTENSPWAVKKLLAKGRLKNADLIIGPLYSKVFADVARYAYIHCIPVVSATISSNSVLAGNPYVFKLMPSDETLIEQSGAYLAGSDSTHNIIVHYGSPDEIGMLHTFQKGLLRAGGDTLNFSVFNIYKSGTAAVKADLSPTGRNNVVILSNDEVKVASFVRKLTDWTEDEYIVAYAPRSWTGFNNLDLDHFDKLRLHVALPFLMDDSNLATQFFIRRYRKRFGTEPGMFAFNGYDVGMHFLKHIDELVSEGPAQMVKVSSDELQMNIGWRRVGDGGFENYRCIMADYTDLDLRPAKD